MLGFARESEEALNTLSLKPLAAVGARAQIHVVIVADSPVNAPVLSSTSVVPTGACRASAHMRRRAARAKP